MDFILNLHITNKKNYFLMSKSKKKKKKKPTQFFVGNYFKIQVHLIEVFIPLLRGTSCFR